MSDSVEPKVQSFGELNTIVKTQIDARIVSFFDVKKKQAQGIDPQVRKLIGEIERLLLHGGKRIRPTLVVIGYRAAGGKDDKLAYDAAFSLELLHAFMLVHDDVMDRDMTRHGKLNLVGVYQRLFARKLSLEQSTQTAEAMAILAGDLLLSFVYENISSLGLSAEITSRLIQQINAVIFDTAAGQQLDVLYAVLGQPSFKKLLKVPHYKTGVYSFVGPLEFGALLSGSDIADYAVLRQYGQNIGIAFQLIDDVLGMFGSSRVTGKSVLSDMHEGKPTVLRYWGHAFSDDKQRAILNACFGNHAATAADHRAVKKILVENGAQSKTLVLAQQYGDRSKASLRESSLDSATVKQLDQLADFCLQRKF